MQALQEISEVPIRFDEISSGAKGYYSNANKEIVIQKGLSEKQTMKTGIHEIVHAKLHDREVMEQSGNKKNKMTKEIEAESVAYTVCEYFGLDTSDYSFPYIAGWSSGMEMKELRASMDTIRETAGEIIDGIKEIMQRQIMREKEQEKLAEGLRQYQNVEFFDVPALFANGRVEREVLPKGIYCYELRGADYDPGYPLIIENHVIVNHAATILTAYPIDLSEREWLWLGDGLNFTGGEQTIQEYQKMMEDRDKAVEQAKMECSMAFVNEELYLSGQIDRYAIYQISGESKGKEYQFMGMDFITSHGIKVNASDYGFVYGSYLSNEETLEGLYEKFNIHQPEGYIGHSLSVSDVVVIQKEGEVNAFYVDSIGFQELPDFVSQRLHEVSMERKRWYSAVTLDTTAVEIEQHEGWWHPVESLEIENEIFYLMKHNEYGDSVASVIITADGDLVAQELENGFDRKALAAIKEYFDARGIIWEPEIHELIGGEMEGRDNQVQAQISEKETQKQEYPPVYFHTLAYAMEHAATDDYLDSRKLNIDCKNAVEEAIRTHFDGVHLTADAVESVIEKYGKERLAFVLACTIQHKSWEGRFSKENKIWAANIPIPENIRKGTNLNLDYVVNSHPVVLDGFICSARERFTEWEKWESTKPFIARYSVVNDVYEEREEREYQFFENIEDAISAYHGLSNHLDKCIIMESTEESSSRMTLIKCHNGIEQIEDIEFSSLSGKWINDEVLKARNRALLYLDNKDTEIVYELPFQRGYLHIQTTVLLIS